MITPENNKNEQDEKKKVVYKETEDDEKKDQGDSSSAADLSRTDLIQKPDRSNRPLGSSHEPGTV